MRRGDGGMPLSIMGCPMCPLEWEPGIGGGCGGMAMGGGRSDPRFSDAGSCGGGAPFMWCVGGEPCWVGGGRCQSSYGVRG